MQHVYFWLARLHHERLHVRGRHEALMAIRCPRCLLEYFAEGSSRSEPALDAAELLLAAECPDHGSKFEV